MLIQIRSLYDQFMFICFVFLYRMYEINDLKSEMYSKTKNSSNIILATDLTEDEVINIKNIKRFKRYHKKIMKCFFIELKMSDH